MRLQGEPHLAVLGNLLLMIPPDSKEKVNKVNVNFHSSELRNALKMLARSVYRGKTCNDALHCVRFRRHVTGGMELGTTNMDTSINVVVNAAWFEDAGNNEPILVDYRNLVRALDAAYRRDGIVTLQTGINNIALLIADGQVYPAGGYTDEKYFPNFDIQHSRSVFVDINPDDVPALAYVARAANPIDERKTALQYVQIELCETGLVAVATDGFRLHRAPLNNSHVVDGNTNWTALIRATDIIAVSKMLPKRDPAAVQLIIPTNGSIRYKMSLEYGLMTVVGTGTVDRYPDWKPIIPNYNQVEAVMGRDELIDAMKTMIKLSREWDRKRDVSGIVFVSPMDNDDVRIAAWTGYDQFVSRTIPLSSMIGDLPEFALNPRFFLDAIRNCRDSSVTLKTAESGREPIAFYDGDRMAVVMPMNINKTRIPEYED